VSFFFNTLCPPPPSPFAEAGLRLALACSVGLLPWAVLPSAARQLMIVRVVFPSRLRSPTFCFLPPSFTRSDVPCDSFSFFSLDGLFPCPLSQASRKPFFFYFAAPLLGFSLYVLRVRLTPTPDSLHEVHPKYFGPKSSARHSLGCVGIVI